ncbi:hypothetical protein WP1_300 [Pseudomonas phage WP1]
MAASCGLDESAATAVSLRMRSFAFSMASGVNSSWSVMVGSFCLKVSRFDGAILPSSRVEVKHFLPLFRKSLEIVPDPVARGQDNDDHCEEHNCRGQPCARLQLGVAESWLYRIRRSAGAWPGVSWVKAGAALASLEGRHGFQIFGLPATLHGCRRRRTRARTLRPCRRPRLRSEGWPADQ